MLIVDTHAILWDAFEPRRLSRRSIAAIDAAEVRGELCWADISLWEMAMLAERGRFPLPLPAASTIADMAARRSVRVLPITPNIAVRANELYVLRGEPADSLIAATALENNAPIVTVDARLAALPGVRSIW